MAFTVPTTEPTTLAAGDTATWKISLSDFPAPTWTLSYVLIRLQTGGLKITITAAADSTNHLIDVAPATTALWLPGEYQWNSTVTDGTDRHQVGEGRLTVTPDYSQAADGEDLRTTARKTLDALESAILKLATAQDTAGKGSITSWSAEGLSITRSSPDLLLRALTDMRDRYLIIVRNEERAKGAPGRKILVRFTNAT